MRTSDGSILSNTSDQLDRWTEYYNSLLNCTLVDIPPVIEGGDDMDINLGPISRAEVVEVIKKTKNGKATDPDNIPSEAMKADPRVTTDIMIKPLEDPPGKEHVPAEWKTGYILSSFPNKGISAAARTGEESMCYPLPSKAFTRVILEKIKQAADTKRREEQAGHRAGRSRMDQIATFHIIIEQFLE